MRDRSRVKIKTRSRGWVEVEVSTREIGSDPADLEANRIAQEFPKKLDERKQLLESLIRYMNAKRNSSQ